MCKAVNAPQTSSMTNDVIPKLTTLLAIHIPSASRITALTLTNPRLPLATPSELNSTQPEHEKDHPTISTLPQPELCCSEFKL